MLLSEYLPQGVKQYIRLLINKRRFPNNIIRSDQMGKNISLGKKSKVNKDVILMDNITIGKYSYINSNSIVGNNVRIGNFTSIGYNCQIGMHEHPTNFITTSPYLYGKNNILDEPVFWDEFKETVHIGNDVWIGSNVFILQGVNIGDGAIIAAGAVVSVESYSIVGGVPAKIIKKRFSEEEIDKLIQLKWWEMSEEQLIENRKIFTTKENWFEKLK